MLVGLGVSKHTNSRLVAGVTLRRLKSCKQYTQYEAEGLFA
jgi:hypothetical protein